MTAAKRLLHALERPEYVGVHAYTVVYTELVAAIDRLPDENQCAALVEELEDLADEAWTLRNRVKQVLKQLRKERA